MKTIEIKKRDSLFFHFSQNNTGGYFHDNGKCVGTDVIIEAVSAKEANKIAEKIGIYFNGVQKGRDCSCCGDRWNKASEEDGAELPMMYGKLLDEIEKGVFRGKAYILYLNGTVKTHIFKLSKEERLEKEKRDAELLKSDYWRIYIYGVEGQDGWGKVAMNVKSGASMVMDGRNFRIGVALHGVDFKRLTEERSPTAEEMDRLKKF